MRHNSLTKKNINSPFYRLCLNISGINKDDLFVPLVFLVFTTLLITQPIFFYSTGTIMNILS